MLNVFYNIFDINALNEWWTYISNKYYHLNICKILWLLLKFFIIIYLWIHKYKVKEGDGSFCTHLWMTVGCKNR